MPRDTTVTVNVTDEHGAVVGHAVVGADGNIMIRMDDTLIANKLADDFLKQSIDSISVVSNEVVVPGELPEAT